MSLILLTNPPSVLTVSGDWTDFVAREDKSNIGTGLSIPIFTLTNWDGSTTKPQIAQGSIIEVGGSIYQADADTALTDEGGLIDGTVHIKLVPSGGGATVVPTLTNDSIPAWDATKGGWYDLDDKFLPFEMTKASAVYAEKSEYVDQNKTVKIYTNGNIGNDITINNDLTVDNDLNVNGGIFPSSTLDSSWSVTTTPTVIPRGIYLLGSGNYWLQAFINSSWTTFLRSGTGSPISSLGGVVISDGTNTRVSHSSSSTTVYYRKF